MKKLEAPAKQVACYYNSVLLQLGDFVAPMLSMMYSCKSVANTDYLHAADNGMQSYSINKQTLFYVNVDNIETSNLIGVFNQITFKIKQKKGKYNAKDNP